MVRRLYRKNSGFTLLELIVAVTILAMLAIMGMMAFQGVFGRARDGKAVTDVKAISDALELYYTFNGNYPETTELKTELIDNADSPKQFIKSGILPTDDATGEDYLYVKSDSLGYCVCSRSLEHESGSGTNATLSVEDDSFSSCSSITDVADGSGTHYCRYASQ